MARRKTGAHDGGHENAERWLLTYADMITLLMVLFVVMYAISNTDVRKFTILAQSFSAAFNTEVLNGSQPITVTSGVETAPDLGQFDSGLGVVASDFRSVNASVRDAAIAAGLGNEVQVTKVPEGIAIQIDSTLLFQSGRAILDPKAIAVLAQLDSVVKPLPNKLRVEGHTDDLPPDGLFFADNWQLSTGRALAVLEQMRVDGIDQSRLSAAGYGEFDNLVPNTSDANRAKNRRVDILILYPPEDAQPSSSPSASASPGPTDAAGPDSILGPILP